MPANVRLQASTRRTSGTKGRSCQARPTAVGQDSAGNIVCQLRQWKLCTYAGADAAGNIVCQLRQWKLCTYAGADAASNVDWKLREWQLLSAA